MAIGQRIKFFRNRKGLTQKQFGEILGFKGRTSDVRLAQYEAEARIPKDDLIEKMAYFLDVDPKALTVPDIDTYDGIMQTFFALEDMYHFQIDTIDGQPCIRLDPTIMISSMRTNLLEWQREFQKLKNGEITKEEYDDWRYKYPLSEARRTKERLKQRRKENLSK